jgi:hypothetical protein
MDFPIISSAVYPNIRSAALFQVFTMPSSVFDTMASFEIR